MLSSPICSAARTAGAVGPGLCRGLDLVGRRSGADRPTGASRGIAVPLPGLAWQAPDGVVRLALRFRQGELRRGRRRSPISCCRYATERAPLPGSPPPISCRCWSSATIPGAGIGWHRDRPVFDHVVGISLEAPATLRLRRRGRRRVRARIARSGAALDLPLDWRGTLRLGTQYRADGCPAMVGDLPQLVG